MTDRPDWRLTNQENYLKGVALVFRRYRQYAKNPEWTHDHCQFCRATFSEKDLADVLHEGYATLDDHHWVCARCFKDFKETFEWEVVSSSDGSNV